jgi:hypothetical protein
VAPRASTFAVGLHDVVDAKSDLDDDALTADRLVSFFDWLRSNGWTAISLDDIARRSRREGAPSQGRADHVRRWLPQSVRTRVYPLALAYGYPIVAALVGDWMDPPAGSMVQFGSQLVPRERFITWDQAREIGARAWSNSHCTQGTAR